MSRVNAIIKQLSISSDLPKEFSQQSSLYARWGFLQARSESEVRKYKEQLEYTFGVLYGEYKENNSTAKENEAKSFVWRHRNYVRINKKLMNAKYNRDVLKVALKSFDIRSSMLMQLGAHYRAELGFHDHMSSQSRKDNTEDLERKAKAVSNMLEDKFKGDL